MMLLKLKLLKLLKKIYKSIKSRTAGYITTPVKILMPGGYIYMTLLSYMSKSCTWLVRDPVCEKTINVLLKWTLFLAGPHIQAIKFSCQLCSNVDVKDSWAHQILQRAHKNFKWPIKTWKFACIWMGYGPLAHFKGPSSFWASIIPVSVFFLSQNAA